MRSTAFALVLFAAVGVAAQDQPKPTVKQCRADAGLWVRQLDEHRSKVTDTQTQQFSTVAGQVSTSDWFTRQDQLMACILTVDHRRAKEYEHALRRIDSLITFRYEGFLLATEQMYEFGQWERQQQQMHSPTAAPSDGSRADSGHSK